MEANRIDPMEQCRPSHVAREDSATLTNYRRGLPCLRSIKGHATLIGQRGSCCSPQQQVRLQKVLEDLLLAIGEVRATSPSLHFFNFIFSQYNVMQIMHMLIRWNDYLIDVLVEMQKFTKNKYDLRDKKVHYWLPVGQQKGSLLTILYLLRLSSTTR